MEQNRFLKGAQILTAASIVARLLGFVYRILIVRLVGTEGIGLYQMVFPLFTLVLVITTAGIPVAVSKLVSQEIARGHQQRAKQVTFLAVLLLTLFGLCSTIVSYRLSPWLAERFFADVRAYWPFVAMVPAILFVSISSAFRGYYQGIQDMIPQASAQVVEQIVRFFLGISLGKYFLRWGIEFGAMGLSLGMVAGELSGLVMLLSMYRRRRLQGAAQDRDRKRLLHEIGELSLPVTATRLVSSIALTLQASLIPQMLLLGGYNIREAMDLYGQFSGVALALLGFPTVLTFSLSISLLPAISEASAINNFSMLQSRSHQAVRMTLLVALPCAVLFFFSAADFTTILFQSAEAAIPLKILAFGAPFIYLQQTTNGLLQGLGRMGTLLLHTLAGAAVNLGNIYFLTPVSGIQGASVAYVIASFLVTVLNLLAIARYTGFSIDCQKVVISPILATSAMVIALYMLGPSSFGLPAFLGLSLKVLGGLSVFLVILGATGGLKRSDLRIVPLIARLLR